MSDKPMKCGAKTKSGGKCKQAAGWGTDHPGEGRCKLHGGASPRGTDSPHWKHGGYAKYAPVSIREKTQEFMNADPVNLANELALTRSLLAEYLSTTEILSDERMYAVSHLINDVRKMVDTIAKIRNQTALTAAEVAFIAARIPEVVSRYVPDERQQQGLVAELFGITGTIQPNVAELSETTDGAE